MNVLQHPETTNSGFVVSMPDREYHAHNSISKSGLDKIHMSPAHYMAREAFEPTPAMIIGTAIHKAVLEPDLFDSEYCFSEAKDRRQAEYKEQVDKYGVERVLLPSDTKNVRAIQAAAHSRPEILRLAMSEGLRELSAFAQDPETGVAVRCRYDLLRHDRIAVDLKKSRDVFEHGFSNAVARYRYHVQVAFYSDTYEWITGEQLQEFWLIAIEDTPPYTIIPYQLDEIAIQAGRMAYRKDLNTYAACLESGEWPTFEPESNLLTLPNWALAEFEELLEVA